MAAAATAAASDRLPSKTDTRHGGPAVVGTVRRQNIETGGTAAVLLDVSDPRDREILLTIVSAISLLLAEVERTLSSEALPPREKPAPVERSHLRLLEGGASGGDPETSAPLP